MDRSIIKSYSTAIVKSFYEKVHAIDRMKHGLTKGQLRELFLTEILNNFLTSQFEVGTGIIIDINGNQSCQTDIIIYDTRILPTVIKNLNLGVYPIESVIGTIEVKTKLDKQAVLDSEDNSKKLNVNLKFHDKLIENYSKRKPFVLNGLIGLNENPILELKDNNDSWLIQNINNLHAICHVKNYSWLKYKRTWHYREKDEMTFEETKRFIAWFMDNIRHLANERLSNMSEKYYGWMSQYIRDM